eukprot:CAMPEP_0174347696 /NCGR_PEP_ID=MMETSP0811_2-20130205/3830_1 /TAXON_ID=73025 ORGANISM="Eutreptiella gymnastica-like, Strain CCMP1594" /NCGR_SAMPLE_ID=MMETSP0811_2 /ASSEMBLY_ACC=CAM_ASM_000667 /LENGTH=144 /DNA_ID=CAMNT_0015473457 /DNA_START=33 /DNA_END=468 /DNA_ORIENTATION=+
MKPPADDWTTSAHLRPQIHLGLNARTTAGGLEGTRGALWKRAMDPEGAGNAEGGSPPAPQHVTPPSSSQPTPFVNHCYRHEPRSAATAPSASATARNGWSVHQNPQTIGGLLHRGTKCSPVQATQRRGKSVTPTQEATRRPEST